MAYPESAHQSRQLQLLIGTDCQPLSGNVRARAIRMDHFWELAPYFPKTDSRLLHQTERDIGIDRKSLQHLKYILFPLCVSCLSVLFFWAPLWILLNLAHLVQKKDAAVGRQIQLV